MRPATDAADAGRGSTVGSSSDTPWVNTLGGEELYDLMPQTVDGRRPYRNRHTTLDLLVSAVRRRYKAAGDDAVDLTIPQLAEDVGVTDRTVRFALRQGEGLGLWHRETVDRHRGRQGHLRLHLQRRPAGAQRVTPSPQARNHNA